MLTPFINCYTNLYIYINIVIFSSQIDFLLCLGMNKEIPMLITHLI